MKTKLSILGFASLASLLCFVLLSAAETPAKSTAMPAEMPANADTAAKDGYQIGMPRAISRRDRQFLEDAAKGGMKEVTISQSVMANIKTSGTRDYAMMMVKDHTAANAELQALAMKKGVTLPSLDPMLMKKWGQRQDVEKDYLKEMAADHKKTVDLFEKGAKSDDAEIAAFAQKTLPTLQHHFEMVESARKTAR